MTATVAKLKTKKGYILDVGCGKDKQNGAIGLDIRKLPGVDIVHDWDELPWPLEDNSVLTLIASHVVEHVNPAKGHFIDWMNECWRIVKPGRQMVVVTPYGGSPLYYADPTHVNPCTHQTFWYFDPHVKIPNGGEMISFYDQYEPAPWEIKHVAYQPAGRMEVLLLKRPDLADYHADGKVHFR